MSKLVLVKRFITSCLFMLSCGQTAFGQNRLVSISCPEVVVPGEEIVVNIEYDVVKDLDVKVTCHLNAPPWIIYGFKTIPLAAGKGTAHVTIPIQKNIPVVDNVYRVRALLLPKGGAYSDKLDVVFREGISCVQGRAQDRLISVDGPEAVSPTSGTVNVSVSFSALENRVVRVDLLQNSPPWRSFGSQEVPIKPGRGTIEVPVVIDPNIPLIQNSYIYSVNIIPKGGGVDQSVDFKAQQNVSCVRDVSSFIKPKKKINKPKKPVEKKVKEDIPLILG